ncbi:MAG: ABC transporter substrate-binding protein [Candidatus Heimdallarchaeaceae archaeon]
MIFFLWVGHALFFRYVGDKETAINSFSSGAVDIVDSRYDADESDYAGVEANLVFTKSLIEQEMAINMLHPIIGTGELTPLGTAEAARYIRKAISHIVPREYIVNEILGGLGLQGVSPMPDGCIGFDKTLQPYSYDIELARQLMEQAGYNLEYETTTETSTETTPTETTPTETTPTETTPTETTPTETTPTETTPTETTPTETTPTETTPTETTPTDTTSPTDTSPNTSSTFPLGSRWAFSVLLLSLLSLSMVYIQRKK